MLSEISQPEKDKYHVFSYVWDPDLKKKDKNVKGRVFGGRRTSERGESDR
jgi:hypothetical protein